MSAPDNPPAFPVKVRHTPTLPASLAGHWDTLDGCQIATDYLTKSRDQLCMGGLSDMHLANAQYLEDISVGTVRFQSAIGMQTAAKERIRWLSAHLAAANQSHDVLVEALRGWQELHDAMLEAGGDLAELPADTLETFASVQLKLMNDTRAALSQATGGAA